MLCIHRTGGVCTVGVDAKGMAAPLGAFRGGLGAGFADFRAAKGKRQMNHPFRGSATGAKAGCIQYLE